MKTVNFSASDYNDLDTEQKAMFAKLAAPKKIQPNQVLYRQYPGIAAKVHNKTVWRLPDQLSKKSEEGVYLNVRYIAVDKNFHAELQRLRQFQDDRGVYVDPFGKRHPQYLFMANRFYYLVTDLQEEVQFIANNVLNEPIVPKAAIVEEKPQPETTLTDEELFKAFQVWDGTKAAFYEKYGITQRKLKKILETYEV